MERDSQCDWCQQKVEPHHASTVVDHLLLHLEKKTGDDKTCAQHYRDYCKFIKEQVDEPRGPRLRIEGQ